MYAASLAAALFCCVAVAASRGQQESLEEVLHHYDRLQHIDIKHRLVKRSTELNPGHIREVEFDTLGKHFHARLNSKQDLLASDFAAYSIDAGGESKEITVDQEDLYDGQLMDDPSSRVHAHWEGNAMLASIVTQHEVYYIEPAWRFINESSPDEMISYKASDMKQDAKKHRGNHLGPQFCGGILMPDVNASSPGGHSYFRRKRQVAEPVAMKPVKDTCPVLLVADHTFFEHMGQKSSSITTTYLLGLMDWVNAIYRNTDFGSGYKGLGFEVKEIRIHEAAYDVDKDANHFNVKKKWDTKALLEMFSRDASFQRFCLAHLFTHQAFDGGVLGLAYIGSPRIYSVGGICSPPYYKGGFTLWLNTGWSSTLNSHHRRILTQEANLVTTHEFGHNWGSEHDPDLSSCSPGAGEGGKYIMYTYSVPGYDPNNQLFSPCSRRAIFEVLQSKSHKCFTEIQGEYCGNQKIEGNEECDGGVPMRQGRDPCCYKDCRLRSSAHCSDTNHVCCLGCRFRGKDYLCRDGSVGDASCKANATCTGTSGECPPSKDKDDGSSCLEIGKCSNGKCQSYCEWHHKISCICDTLNNTCLRCCKDSPSSPCKPFASPDTGFFLNLPDKTRCLEGYCEKSACVKQDNTTVQRIWKVIENLHPSRVVAFMRANIVGTVIILSLLIWIPSSIAVWCVDRKKAKIEKEEEEWMNIRNTTLSLPRQKEPIKTRTYGSHYRPNRRAARMCHDVNLYQSKASLV